jgi:hypothetical protein
MELPFFQGFSTSPKEEMSDDVKMAFQIPHPQKSQGEMANRYYKRNVTVNI